ncbi:hypothetical protein AC579_5861 [Pseudocercospora musae]|uniref:Uncharacterized protein n=1 Tax=Pseudocercospora musae TaxID=113226 RepID=A0A139ILD3_9PEZI|nr:hypothetical protein AC579_5861 [Pseudocercospora musae]
MSNNDPAEQRPFAFRQPRVTVDGIAFARHPQAQIQALAGMRQGAYGPTIDNSIILLIHRRDYVWVEKVRTSLTVMSLQTGAVGIRARIAGTPFSLQAWPGGKKDPWTSGRAQRSFEATFKAAELEGRVASGAHLRSK